MMTRFRILLFFALCVGVLSGARATSCVEMNNRFYFACNAAQCTGMFSVRDVAAFNSCSRHAQVEAIDASVLGRAADLVGKDRPAGSAGIFELTMTQAYWGGSREDPLDWFSANVGASVIKVDADASPAAVAALRAKFESQSRRVYWSGLLFQLGYWGSSAVALLLLIHSVQRFFNYLYCGAVPRKWTPLLVPMAVQLLLMGGSTTVYFTQFIRDYWLGLLLLAAVPLILACEAWAWLLEVRTQRSTGLSR